MGVITNPWPNVNGSVATPPVLKPFDPTLIVCGGFPGDFLKTGSHNINEADIETKDLLGHFESFEHFSWVQMPVFLFKLHQIYVNGSKV